MYYSFKITTPSSEEYFGPQLSDQSHYRCSSYEQFNNNTVLMTVQPIKRNIYLSDT